MGQRLSGTESQRISENASVFFSNQSRPGGVLTAPGEITKDTATRLKEEFQKGYSGENAGKVAVLGDGLTFQPIAVKVGVTAEMFRGLSGPDALQLYVSTLEKAGLNQREMTFYMESLADEATALIPLLANNGAEMNRLADAAAAAAAAGGIMSAESIAASKDFKASLDLLSISLSGAQTAIAVELLPAATRLVDWMTTNGVPALRSFGETLGRVIAWFEGLPAPVQKTAAALTAAFAVGGPVLVGVGAFSIAVAAISAPVLAAVAAVAALTAGAALFWPEIKAATDAMVSFATGVMESLGNLGDDIVRVFSELPAKMMEIGRQIIDGLWQGLTQKYHEVVDGVTGMVGGLVDGVKERLGIHSPSRVFAEIGRFIMEGLGGGIRENAATAQGSLDAAVVGMTSSANELGRGFNSMESTASQAFKGIVTGTQSMSDAVRNILGQLSNRFLDSAFSSIWSGFGQTGWGAAIGSFFNPGANANGTNNWRGGWSWVNERGGELMNLPNGTQIIPHDISKRMVDQQAGGGGDININVTGATGNAEVQRMVAAGVTQGLSQYDRAMPQRLQQINQNPRFR